MDMQHNPQILSLPWIFFFVPMTFEKIIHLGNTLLSQPGCLTKKSILKIYYELELTFLLLGEFTVQEYPVK